MYTIYADGELLYAPYLSHEGYGVISPRLTVELNKAGSLEYTLPPNNVMYDSVSKLKSIITVFNNDEEIFRGRVLDDEKDFFKQKKTYCEGELAFLLDSKQRPYSYSGTKADLFRQYISNHNARVDSYKRFTVGNITISTADDEIKCNNTEYNTTIDEITNNLLDYEGGYLKTRGSGSTRYIDYLSKSGNTISQTIEFGVNLLDITEYISAENIFTVLIPLGKTLYDDNNNVTGKLTIESVNDGKDYIENETAIALFGRIENSYEWSDVEDPSKLKSLGESLLEANIEMSVSLDIKAIDLNLLNVNVAKIHVGDWVRVISLPHGLNKEFQCTKIVYDLVSPDNTEYIFGSTYTSLTEQQSKTDKNVKGSVAIVKSAAITANSSANAANKASKDVETVISSMPTTYVQTSTFNTYKTETNAQINDINETVIDLVARVSALEK